MSYDYEDPCIHKRQVVEYCVAALVGSGWQRAHTEYVHMLASTAYCRGRDLIRYPPKSNRRRSPKSLFIY